MNKMVMLDYTFLFEPDNSWGHLYQFEQELASFFRGKGFEAEIVKAIEGQQGRRILLIKRVDPMVAASDQQQIAVQNSPQNQLSKFQTKFQGRPQNKPKWVPTKGYLKR